MTKANRNRQAQKMIAITPVAQYRGVGIIEMDGEERAVWRGIEYKTDGRSWLMYRGDGRDRLLQRLPSLLTGDDPTEKTAEGCVNMTGAPNERVAKQFLDTIAAAGVDPAEFFMSCLEIWTLLGHPPIPPLTQWDEVQGVFVE